MSKTPMANETNTYTNIHQFHARAQDAASEERPGDGAAAEGVAPRPASGMDLYAPEA